LFVFFLFFVVFLFCLFGFLSKTKDG